MFILSSGVIPVCGKWWFHIPAPLSSGQRGLILRALFLGQRNVVQFLSDDFPGLTGIQNLEHGQQKFCEGCVGMCALVCVHMPVCAHRDPVEK